MSSNKEKAVNATYMSILGNLGMAIVKGLAGVFGHSYALIADAIESTADVFSSFLVLFGLKYSTRPADENHPYGHGKAEPLVTFAIVIFLVISATVIAYQSIEHIRTPHRLPEKFTLIILAIIVGIKEAFFRIMSKKSIETHSSSLKADAWHHRSDAITSLMAFIGISIAILTDYPAADDWAALFASGFIVYNAYLIFRPALGEILDEHLYDDMIVLIRDIATTVPGVIDTEKCHVRKTGMTYFVDLHLTVNGQITVLKGHDIAHDLKDAIQREIPQIADVLIHIEPDGLGAN